MPISIRNQAAFTPVERRLLAVLGPPVFVATGHCFDTVNGEPSGIGGELASAVCAGALLFGLCLLIRAVAPAIERGFGALAASAASPDARWHRCYGDVATGALSFVISRYAQSVLGAHGAPPGTVSAALAVGVLALVVAVAMTGGLYAGTGFLLAQGRKMARQGGGVRVDGTD